MKIKDKKFHPSILTVLLLPLLVFNAGAFQSSLNNNPVHENITKDAAGLLNGHNSLVYGMTQNVVDDLESYNWKIDGLTGGYQTTKYHFDDECFHDASSFLINQKNAVINHMLLGHGEEARYELAFALHCVQDFYAHANFIDRGYRGGAVYHPEDDSNKAFGIDLITKPESGWANRNWTCVVKARSTLGVSWLDDDNGKLGRAGLSILTTGWTGWKPDHKVNHGGLNKDKRAGNVTNHDDAYQAAVNATVEYLKLILDDPRIINNAAALTILMDDVENLSVVCDNSKDMAPHFRTIMNTMGDLALGLGSSRSYLLQLFDYEPVLQPYKTGSRSDFISKLNNSQLSTTVGPCSKAWESALYMAINKSERNGNLHFFSNAGALPSSTGGKKRMVACEILARQKGIRIRWNSIEPRCYHPSNPFDLGRFVYALGGQVVLLPAGMLTNVTRFMHSELSGDTTPVVSVSGNMLTNTFKELTVPIDSTVSSVTFLVSVETNNAISFVTPSGTDVTNAPCCTLTELGPGGRAAIISQPQAGNWKIRFQGSGHFSVSANVATPIQIGRFGFWEVSSTPSPGEPSHTVHTTRIPGQPTQETNTALAFLSGSYTNVSFALVTPSGDLIQSIAMSDGMFPTNVPGEWKGTVALPAQPFKVAVTGSDTNGYPFLRTFPQIFQIQPVEVRSLQRYLSVLTPGVPTHVRYQVSNLGEAADFDVGMSAGRAIISNMGPTNLTLAMFETSIVEADILLPAGTNDSTLEYVTISASRVDDPTLFNGAVDEFMVGPDYVGDTSIISSNLPVTFSLVKPERITNGPAGGSLVLIGGTALATLDLNGNFETINGLASQGVEANTRVTSDIDTTLIVGDNDATGTFGGKIMNAVGLVKIGNGTQTLTGANTYTNDTRVVSGALALEGSGSISNTPRISVMDGSTFDVSQASGGWTLNAGQTLTGGGVVNGSVTAVSGSWIKAGDDGSGLSFRNDLTLNGDVTNVFLLLQPPTYATIAANGNLTLNGTNPVIIAHNTLEPGSYPLIVYGGSLTGDADPNLPLFCFPDGARQTAELDSFSIPHVIVLRVTDSAGTLTWTGDGVLNNWDVTATNWLNGASPDRFFPDDSVIFDDSGSRTPAVNLVSNLAPSSVLVNATGTYTFAGPGKISGNASLVKDGTGELTIANTNDYAGDTAFNAGTVMVNGSLAGGGAVTVAAGATLGGRGTIMGPVIVQAGATLAPGIWLGSQGQDGEGLTVSNTLSLAGTTALRLNKTAGTNDHVRGITTVIYGGTLAVTNRAGTLATGDSFKLFSATSYAGTFASISPVSPGAGLVWNTTTLASDGRLRISANVVTNPTNITATVIGGNTLQLAWPADHIGWTLEFQTNSPGVGLTTNWLPVTGSSLTNQMTIPINPGNGSGFYRMKFTP